MECLLGDKIIQFGTFFYDTVRVKSGNVKGYVFQYNDGVGVVVFSRVVRRDPSFGSAPQ